MAQEPTPVKNWDVSCPWCGAIALLKVRGRTREGRFDGGFDCAECRVHRVQNGDARDIDAYASAFMDLMREQASKQAMMARNPDPLDTLRAMTQTPKIITGSLKPYMREDPNIVALARAYDVPGVHRIPLTANLRAEVQLFYQESMRHARESGSLPYALSHAP